MYNFVWLSNCKVFRPLVKQFEFFKRKSALSLRRSLASARFSAHASTCFSSCFMLFLHDFCTKLNIFDVFRMWCSNWVCTWLTKEMFRWLHPPLKSAHSAYLNRLNRGPSTTTIKTFLVRINIIVCILCFSMTIFNLDLCFCLPDSPSMFNDSDYSSESESELSVADFINGISENQPTPQAFNQQGGYHDTVPSSKSKAHVFAWLALSTC